MADRLSKIRERVQAIQAEGMQTWVLNRDVLLTDLAYLLTRLEEAERVCGAADRLLDSDGHATDCGVIGRCSCDVRFKLSGARGKVVSSLTTWQAARDA